MVLIISLKSSTALNYNLLRAIMEYRNIIKCLYNIRMCNEHSFYNRAYAHIDFVTYYNTSTHTHSLDLEHAAH